MLVKNAVESRSVPESRGAHIHFEQTKELDSMNILTVKSDVEFLKTVPPIFGPELRAKRSVSSTRCT